MLKASKCIGNAWFTFLVCYFCLDSLSEQFLDAGVVWVVEEEEKGKPLFCQLLGMVGEGGGGWGREGEGRRGEKRGERKEEGEEEIREGKGKRKEKVEKKKEWKTTMWQ